MIETTASPARPIITARQARKRRASKTSYRASSSSGSSSSRLHHVVDSRRGSRSPGSPSLSSPRNGRIAPSASQDSLFNFEGLDARSFTVTAPLAVNTYFPAPDSGQRSNEFSEEWNYQSMGMFPMGSPTQFSPPIVEDTSAAFQFGGYAADMQSAGVDFSWNGFTPSTSYAGTDMDYMSISSGLPFGSYGSMVIESPDTATSSVSGSWVMPIPDCEGGQSSMSEVVDLELTPAYYQTGVIPDSNGNGLLGGIPYEHCNFPQQQGQNYGTVYGTQDAQLSTATLIQQDLFPISATSISIDQIPWNSQQAQLSRHFANANAGHMAYEPDRGLPYRIHLERQRMLDDTGQQSVPRSFGPEPVNMVSESEDESMMEYSGDSSYALSHDSPYSLGSPLSYAASPLHTRAEHHPHMLSDYTEPEGKLKRTRRKLSDAEKVQAKDVRDNRACWACHVSKTKCSPCGPGKPCELCATLALKRRFCKFSCFNDTLESLATFWVPKWLTGHFTQADVESFIARNAAHWGTQNIRVHLSWGYRKPVEADVVAIELRGDSNQMAISNQTVSVDGSRPQLVRRQSPPLGVPLGSMMELQAASAQYTQRIVDDDLQQYVKIAYDDQDSMLPERLLSAIGTFYRANARAGRKSELLCQAIEMHITFTILERSLVLDSESIEQVQNQLRQTYPERAVPRCAQRQIKLAFFLLQRQRIENVLKNWGEMMWQIKGKTKTQTEWALSFSIFMVLTLALDKIFGAAWYFCEGNIENHGGDPMAERQQLDQLVTLAEREFFERCKEIFHWKFKTRKTGGSNPIRYGVQVFRDWTVDASTEGLIKDLRAIVREFETDVRRHRSSICELPDDDAPYLDAGRLACIFLDDFLEH